MSIQVSRWRAHDRRLGDLIQHASIGVTAKKQTVEPGAGKAASRDELVDSSMAEGVLRSSNIEDSVDVAKSCSNHCSLPSSRLKKCPHK